MDNTPISTNPQETPEPRTPEERATSPHPYHPPTLTRYGSMVELVQNLPSVGGDGGVADCSRS